MKHIFIINPAAGGGKSTASLEKAINYTCKDRKVDYMIYKTKKVGDATAFVSSLAQSNDMMRVYACGGDGTLNEVISGAPTADNLSFGLIPHGTGNDFYRNFTNKNAFFNIGHQLDGDIVPIDIFKCNDRYGINMINIGFDCHVVQETGRLQAKYPIPKKMAYFSGIAKVFFRKIGLRFRLILDNGEIFDSWMTLSLIANAPFCGGGFKAAPLARLDDGLLDVCVIDKVSRPRFLRAISAYKKGDHLNERHHFDFISYRQISSLTIKFAEPQFYCIDGQIDRDRELKISVLPRALKFIVPATSSCTLLS